MLPLTKFKDMLMDYKEQMVVDMDELITAADIISARPNYLTVDERGYYHVQASGDIKEVIYALEKQLEKLNRIKAQKDKT
jgi:hypothetical protein